MRLLYKACQRKEIACEFNIILTEALLPNNRLKLHKQYNHPPFTFLQVSEKLHHEEMLGNLIQPFLS